MFRKVANTVTAIITGKKINVPNDILKIVGPDEAFLHAFQTAGFGGSITGLPSFFVTDSRIIKRIPRDVGLRADIEDYWYRDMANVRISKGIVRSSIYITMRHQSNDLIIEDLPREGVNEAVRDIQYYIQQNNP